MIGSRTDRLILIILLIVILLFGARKLPDLGKSLGEGIRELQEFHQGQGRPRQSEEPRAPQGLTADP